ncbi:hypothetical protein L9F63_009743, partial [Diploptera punctata]
YQKSHIIILNLRAIANTNNSIGEVKEIIGLTCVKPLRLIKILTLKGRYYEIQPPTTPRVFGREQSHYTKICKRSNIA